MQVDLRSAALGGLLALSFGALSGFQTPSFISTPGGPPAFAMPATTVRVEGIPAPDQLWRMTHESGAAPTFSDYTVPLDKALVVTGIVNSTGYNTLMEIRLFDSGSGLEQVLVRGSTYEWWTFSTALRFDAGETVRLWCNSNDGATLTGYLVDG